MKFIALLSRAETVRYRRPLPRRAYRRLIICLSPTAPRQHNLPRLELIRTGCPAPHGTSWLQPSLGAALDAAPRCENRRRGNRKPVARARHMPGVPRAVGAADSLFEPQSLSAAHQRVHRRTRLPRHVPGQMFDLGPDPPRSRWAVPQQPTPAPITADAPSSPHRARPRLTRRTPRDRTVLHEPAHPGRRGEPGHARVQPKAPTRHPPLPPGAGPPPSARQLSCRALVRTV